MQTLATNLPSGFDGAEPPAREVLPSDAMMPLRHFAGIRWFCFAGQDLHIWIGRRTRRDVREVYHVIVTRLSEDESRVVCYRDNEPVMSSEVSCGLHRGGKIGLAMISAALQPERKEVADVA